jgi:hypothetical protein
MLSGQGNNNLYVGDPTYRMTFFLDFKSARTEQKYREESFVRTKHLLQGFLILSLLITLVCRYQGLILVALSSLLTAGALTFYNKSAYLIRSILILNSVYFSLYCLENVEYFGALLLITLQYNFSNLVTIFSWKLQLGFNMLTFILLLGYMKIQHMYYPIAFIYIITDFLKLNAFAITIVAFLEKIRRERWVLLDTFKKSTRIMESLFDVTGNSIFVVDMNQ